MVIVVFCRNRRKKYLLTVNETRKLPSYRTLTFELEEHLKDQKEEGENNIHEEEARQKLPHVLLLGNRQSWV
jgi:hypothetical protein